MHPLLSVILAMASCNQEASPSKISQLIREHCTSKRECVIDMGNIVKTPWEKMYVFKESASLEQINQILGFQYKYFEDR